MNNEEAIEIIEKQHDALFQATVALKVRDEQEGKISELLIRLKECEREKVLEREKMRKDRILLRTYQRLYPGKVTICETCNGAGGFDEYGPCEDCDQAGVVITQGD